MRHIYDIIEDENKVMRKIEFAKTDEERDYYVAELILLNEEGREVMREFSKENKEGWEIFFELNPLLRP